MDNGGGAILRGEKDTARTYVADEPDVAAIREEYGLSQAKFAALLGISVRTLQNWEQGRRHPHGPARVLLKVAARHPRAVLDVVKLGTSPLHSRGLLGGEGETSGESQLVVEVRHELVPRLNEGGEVRARTFRQETVFRTSGGRA